MIETRPLKNYQNKIMSYIDGTLSAEERVEFEAAASTHPELQTELKNKENEMQLLKSLLPNGEIFQRSYTELKMEMRSSVFNLLKEERPSFWQRVNNWMEERFSR